MRSVFQSNRTALALCFNGVVLLMILLAIVARDGRGIGPSVAFGQASANAGNPAGVVVMPGQLSPNTWGCYVMDSQNQTLSVYQFSPGEKELRLAAARDIQYDRRLTNFNTVPSPTDIRKLDELQREPSRAAPSTSRSPEDVQQ